jgi:hypothetical protein
MNANLSIRQDPHTVLEADSCAAVEAEEILSHVVDTPVAAERARKAVCHAEGALEEREPQGRGQADQREIRFRELQSAVIIVLGHNRGGSQ